MSNRNTIPDPIFREPAFNEPQVTAHPTYCNFKHLANKPVYDYIHGAFRDAQWPRDDEDIR